MFAELKTDWRIIRENPPGQRFQARYRYRTFDSPTSTVRKTIKVAIGFLLIPIGIFLWFVPGPGWLTIFLGLALLGGESMRIACFLDGIEVSIRNIVRKILDRASKS